MNSKIADIRTSYTLSSLDIEDTGNDPIVFFQKWFQEAVLSEVFEVNAMTLATATKDGIPDARTVLLKGITNDSFLFYTNYESRKGKELEENPKACLVFFWSELERQIRIEGNVTKVSKEESEEYFHSRPRESQIGAVASPQSQKIPDRKFLEERFAKLSKEFEGKEVELPNHWGGYAVQPIRIEFWQGRSSRLHDRIVFEKKSGSSWDKFRVAP
ncbi:pyridoxamine 5'-phosphate oxidase [Leptospira kmetyi]|uniref:Pyridoxine/pyridoxamine 5'-phosphate oxidase n=1 Tax=Leptospira kmetyi TaxID=408139 RepID=A0A2M9XW85_9LEPT|nr:pyridoxamine 5'-phosphate oxidase [Leptospira kmetyi]AYV57623.1 pyridoxamine 5'-phosphate oxidase [Leptospira kmetyi]PJZ31896.1 pyridoxamine 5'-phosphate oxidase [Leptospira kmetyi]PJZ43590.1 pyridoxamine 5'-phosphate oxidase [Leptospira kmetyi]TGK21545.1 pyridoxamine 5'-phosphate oxidase [Leptospira kmetyi]TGK28472.1 pyridoxamine 5'-phosphate oxidase [Leptospira kmetyi]